MLTRPLLLVAVVLMAIVTIAPQPVAAVTPSYTGWAVDAYPQYSAAELRAMFQRQKDAGANLIWIGHNNPVAVDPDAWEVALSYASYRALTTGIQADAAQAIIDGQKRALTAARATGMKVVFPIGYRTQMGQAWNDAHPTELRRGPDGSLIATDGADASAYSAAFRADTKAYYRWVQQEFVAPYRDVILMVMLSNEPTGVDYSPAADAEFRSRHGFSLAEAGGDFERAATVGKFQANAMNDYARWAAEQWQSIDAAVTVTIAFDGGVGRTNGQAPVIESTFRDMPSNFEPAWDLNLRNGGPRDPLNDSDVTGFALLAGTLAHHSARYGRPYWLWTSGNSWGLGQGSADPSSIADAIVNLRAAANIARQANGALRGIAVWAYNVRQQGLYNDGYTTVYRADDLFSRLTGQMPAVRAILEGPAGGGPTAFVVAPNAMAWRQLGEQRVKDVHSYRSYNFGDLVSLVRSGLTPAIVDNLEGVDLSRARMIVVLAREARDLGDPTSNAIKSFRARGGVVVSTDEVSGVKGYESQWKWQGVAPELFFADKTTATLAGPPESLGFPRLANSFVFRGPSELIVYGGTALDPAVEMRAWAELPAGGRAVAYETGGTVMDEFGLPAGLVPVPTQRHSFVIVRPN